MKTWGKILIGVGVVAGVGALACYGLKKLMEKSAEERKLTLYKCDEKSECNCDCDGDCECDCECHDETPVEDANEVVDDEETEV